MHKMTLLSSRLISLFGALFCSIVATYGTIAPIV